MVHYMSTIHRTFRIRASKAVVCEAKPVEPPVVVSRASLWYISQMPAKDNLMGASECIEYLRQQPNALWMCLGYTGGCVNGIQSHPDPISITTMQLIQEDSRNFTLRIHSKHQIKCTRCFVNTSFRGACCVKAGKRGCYWCESTSLKPRYGCGAASCPNTRVQVIHVGLVCPECACYYQKEWNALYRDSGESSSARMVVGSDIHGSYSAVNREKGLIDFGMTLQPLKDGEGTLTLFKRCAIVRNQE